jgi:hypothetical protein
VGWRQRSTRYILGPRLLGWLSVHPDPALRRQLLNDTDALFRARFLDALSIGASGAIAAISLLLLLFVLSLGSKRSLGEAGV